VRVENPILPGFNPDPSICRVGDDFYIATSTFEWFPGVQIWHSRDLTEWTLVHRPLDRPALLRMEGIQSSGGIWAPCLTHDSGLFYLVYTIVRTWRGELAGDEGVFKDTHNYVTTSPEIAGPWSDPAYLNSTGFDPSMFHHGRRKYLLNMEWDYRGTPAKFSGILLQEYSPEQRRLVGPATKIFTGTSIGMTEGPHLYERDGWFYLVTAEGGTSFGHAVSVARSRSIDGPYEVHPANPLLSSIQTRPADLDAISAYRDTPRGTPPDGFYSRPQKAGHASLCQVSRDEWALVHLAGRPVEGSLHCPLGRETCIQRVSFRDGWPYVVDDDGTPVQLPSKRVRFAWSPPGGGLASAPAAYRSTDRAILDEFDGPALHPAFRYLRRGPGDDVSLTARPGYLRVIGRESPVSPFVQSVIGVSVCHFDYAVETTLDFQPGSFQQMAGLMVRYDERNQYYLRIAGDDRGGRVLGLFRLADGRVKRPLLDEVPLPAGPVKMELEVHGASGRFFWSTARSRNEMPAVLDMLQLSDEGANPLGFTGTFVCLACHDMTGAGLHADFARFSYTAL
jgi:xylan 1,4-beta-xylosidase